MIQPIITTYPQKWQHHFATYPCSRGGAGIRLHTLMGGVVHVKEGSRRVCGTGDTVATVFGKLICCLTQRMSLVLLMVKFVSLDYWYQIYLLFNYVFPYFLYIFLTLFCYVGSLCMYTLLFSSWKIYCLLLVFLVFIFITCLYHTFFHELGNAFNIC